MMRKSSIQITNPTECGAIATMVHSNRGLNPTARSALLDSYDTNKGEIVSRTFTQLSGVTAQTAYAYINELATKYPAGTLISNTPSNHRMGLPVGQVTRGQLALEVPVQTGRIPVPQSVLNYANNKKIIIRDPNGRIY